MTIKKLSGKQSVKRFAALTALAAVLMASIFSVSAFAKTVYITDGEKKISMLTLSSDTDTILENAGVSYSEDDSVVCRKISSQVIDIKVFRAFDVNIKDGENVCSLTLNGGTVATALKKAGITLDKNDSVFPVSNTELTQDTDIEVMRRVTVNITSDGKTVSHTVLKGSVEQALRDSCIKLGTHDTVDTGLNEEITDGMNITVQRISYKTSTVTEAIPYDVVNKNTDELYVGETKVSQKGENGEKVIIAKGKYVDGEYDSSEIIDTKVTKESKPQVNLVGTKEKKLSFGTVSASNGVLTDADGNQVSYSQVYSGSCTAYSYSTGSVTASGMHAEYGRVAVNPNLIPYGTKLYIASPDGSVVYGYCVAADTGGALMDGRVLVDLFYNTDYECFQFGRRTMNVYVLS